LYVSACTFLLWDLLDATQHEIAQLKAKSSLRVPTHRYYTGPCYIPPEGSFAAELESLNSNDKDVNRSVVEVYFEICSTISVFFKF